MKNMTASTPLRFFEKLNISLSMAISKAYSPKYARKK